MEPPETNRRLTLPVDGGSPGEGTRISRFAMEFQPDAVEIEQRPIPAFGRLVLYLVIGLLISAIAWAGLSHVDRIVVAVGKLITTQPKMVVQPVSTSVIRSLDVKVGQIVHQGQVLARLDPTFTDANLAQLRAQRVSAQAEYDRLSAELDGREYDPGPTPSEEAALQSKIFQGRKQEYEARLGAFDEDIERIEAAMHTNQREQMKLGERLRVLEEIEDMYAKIHQQNQGSLLKYLQNKDVRLEVGARLESRRNQVAELEHEKKAASAKRAAFVSEWRTQTGGDLQAANEHLIDVREQLKKAERMSNLVVLTAPADAIVLETSERAVGSVVQEAEPVMSLVPLDVPLEAEVLVPSEDIGHLSVGDLVRIKLEAFPFQKHGTLSGKVRTISEDAFQVGETTPATVYRARIALDPPRLRNLPANFRLIPGMQLVAEIKVGSRTVLSYFLYPILRGLDESIREP